MTIKDIANLSGYAVGTVSRVLNNQPNVSPAAREKILAVVQQQRFTLNNNAKHLKQQVATGIAVIVKGTQNMLFAAVVERIQSLARAHGSAVLIHYLDEDGNEIEQALQIARERRPQGLVFLGTNIGYFQALFPALALPCVMITNSGASFSFENLSSISIDDEEAAAQAISHLVDLGHRHIAIIGGNTDTSDAASCRFRGCQRAFAQHQLPFTPAQFYPARFAMDSGYEAMGVLLARYRALTAVFAMSDVQAIGAVRALHEHGYAVPQDISVIGFDGIPLGQYLTPQLTTIAQDAVYMAQRGIEILFGHIEGTCTHPMHERAPFHLLQGESTQTPKTALER